MKKVTLLCGMLLALAASVASAAPGVNIRWGACFGDGGLSNRNGLCDDDGGTNALVGSFKLGAPITGVSGIEIVIDVATASSSLPPWWQFNQGECRQGSLSMNPTISFSAAACFDWANAGASGGLASYSEGVNGPNTARILGGFAVNPNNLRNLIANREYFGFNALINNVNTVGPPTCDGCTVPACIVLNSVKVVTPPPPAGQPDRSVLLTGPTDATGTSNSCTWQGGIGVVTPKGSGCPLAVSIKNRTWSTVKTLYR